MTERWQRPDQPGEAAGRRGRTMAAGRAGLALRATTSRHCPATSATAARRPAPPPASPTASSTTGPAPDWSSRPSAAPPAPARSGSTRFRDILVLKVVKRLLDAGVSLQQIRTAVTHLRERGIDDLTRVTLMSDGASVYECTSHDEVIDLLQGGQGVFGIAVGRVWREIEGIARRAAQRAPRRAECDSTRERRARCASSGPHDQLSSPLGTADALGGLARFGAGPARGRW